MYKGEFFNRVGATALLLSGTASLRNKLVIKSKQIEPRSKYDFLKRPSNASLLNYVPFVPTCLTCLCTLRALNYYVPTCLHALHYCVPTCLLALNYYVPTCLSCLRPSPVYMPLNFTCLRGNLNTLIYVPTCPLLLRAYVH